MLSRKVSLCLCLIIGSFYTTVASGEKYRCLDSTGHFEFTNRPCIEGSSTDKTGGATAIAPSPRYVGRNSVSSVRAAGACKMQLAPEPRASGMKHSYADELDHLEERLYKEVRSGRISWVQLVDTFYARCVELYPTNDTSARELPAYQRVLAEQMDARSLTESQWIYLLDTKTAEIEARNQIIQNTRQRSRNCEIVHLGTLYPQLECN